MRAIKLLRDVDFGNGEILEKDSIYLLKYRTDIYHPEVESWQINRIEKDKVPKSFFLKFKEDAVPYSFGAGELSSAEYLKLLQGQQGHISFSVGKEVDYVVDQIMDVVTKYFREGNPKATAGKTFSAADHFLIIGRAYNSVQQQLTHHLAHYYTAHTKKVHEEAKNHMVALVEEMKEKGFTLDLESLKNLRKTFEDEGV